MSLLTLPLPPHRGSQLRIYVKIRTPPQPGARSEPYRASGSGSRPSTWTWVQIRIRAPIKDPTNIGDICEQGSPSEPRSGSGSGPGPYPIRLVDPDPDPDPESGSNSDSGPGTRIQEGRCPKSRKKKIVEVHISCCWAASAFPIILTYSRPYLML